MPAAGSPTSRWATCRVLHDDAPRLRDLVADPPSFVAGDLFRRAVWSPSGEGGRDPSLFADLGRLWGDLLDRHARTPFFRLVRDGATLAPSTYCRRAGVGHRTIGDVVQPNRVVELHQAGATVVLQGLQLTDPHLGRFTNNLALQLDHPVQVNAYLTPAAAKGLELHFDFHDVFVVQLDGRKRWRVWEPLARTEAPVRDGTRPPMPAFDELGEPALDLELVAGDCLYLPRGFPHAAEAVDDASAHLTVGVMALTWHKAMRHALDRALVDRAVRASLPAGQLEPDTHGGAGRALDGAAHLLHLLDTVASHLPAGGLRSWLAAEIWRRQPATRRRPLVPPPIRLDEPVHVTPGPLLWLTDVTPERIAVGLGDRRLHVPTEAAGLVGALFATPGCFVAAEWDGALDAGSRQVVLDRFAAEGVVAPGPRP